MKTFFFFHYEPMNQSFHFQNTYESGQAHVFMIFKA